MKSFKENKTFTFSALTLHGSVVNTLWLPWLLFDPRGEAQFSKVVFLHGGWAAWARRCLGLMHNSRSTKTGHVMVMGCMTIEHWWVGTWTANSITSWHWSTRSMSKKSVMWECWSCWTVQVTILPGKACEWVAIYWINNRRIFC